jgi:hypothetical protein
VFFPMILLRSIEPPPAGSTPPGQGQHPQSACYVMLHTQAADADARQGAAAGHGKHQVSSGYICHGMRIESNICRAAPPPVDLGQRGVVLRCFEALTGDGQLLVSAATAVY